jgi:hypothetical protein
MSVVNVPMDSSTFAWLQISFWAFSIAVIAALVIFAYHMIDQYRTPIFSKRARDAHRQRSPMLLLARDDGFVELEGGKYVGNEGWVETAERGKPKTNYIGLFPRSSKISDTIAVAPGKDLDATRKLAKYINWLNTRKLFARGSSNPLWVAVSAKGIVMNIQAVAAIQLTEQLQTTWDTVINSASSKPFPIDVFAMKQMIVSTSYNTSLLKSLAKVHEQIGFEKKSSGEALSKWIVIFGIAMVIVGVVALGAAAFI